MCPYCSVLYCNVSLLLSTLYAMCPYYIVLYMQYVLIIEYFICNVAGPLRRRAWMLSWWTRRTSGTLASSVVRDAQGSDFKALSPGSGS